MIEIIIKNFLEDRLSAPAFLERESEMPETFVLFERTSGTESNHLPTATIAFQSYAKSMYGAAMLNEELKTVLKELIELDEISKIRLNSDYNFTDTTTKEYRYQAVFDINYY